MKLVVVSSKCTNCRTCLAFCSFHHERAIWPAKARLLVTTEHDDGPFRPEVCQQCEDAACAAVCPELAITRDPQTAAWLVDEELCTGCQSCVDACPYGMMFFDEQRDVAFKCDLCDGGPECAARCPSGAITLNAP